MRFVFAVLLCLSVGTASATVSNVYWRVDLNQGTSIIAYGQGATEEAAWLDCYRLQAITRAMTAAETRKVAVAAVTTSVVRWCKNPMRYATVTPDPVAPTPVNCVVSEWSAWQAGSWGVCTGGQQSRTETRSRTILTQPANGGTACPVLSESRTVTQTCAALSWTAPTTNRDGSALTNLAGYRVHYGTSPGALTQTIQVASPSTTRYTVSNLSPGVYYFAVRAYTSGGAESELSNIWTKTVQ